MVRRIYFGITLSIFVVAVVSGCGEGTGSHSRSSIPAGNSLAEPAQPLQTSSTLPLRGKIQHIVVVIQENRSLDNLFYGFPGADTVTHGMLSSGSSVPLQPISFLAPYDIGHEEANFIASYDNGKMDGFDTENVGGIGGSGPITGATTPPPYPQYGYVPAAERQPYVQMGSTYVVADRFFPSQIDSSFSAHQYLIAAQTGNAVDNPAPPIWGCDAAPGVVVPTLNPDRTQGPGIFTCFDYPTIGDKLDGAHLSWHFYAPPINEFSIWSAYDAIRHVRYGVDWQQNVLSPETRILTDVASGNLASVTWVVPDGANSDHASSQSTAGPQWVSAIVNAVGKSRFGRRPQSWSFGTTGAAGMTTSLPLNWTCMDLVYEHLFL